MTIHRCEHKLRGSIYASDKLKIHDSFEAALDQSCEGGGAEDVAVRAPTQSSTGQFTSLLHIIDIDYGTGRWRWGLLFISWCVFHRHHCFLALDPGTFH